MSTRKTSAEQRECVCLPPASSGDQQQHREPATQGSPALAAHTDAVEMYEI